MDAKILGSSVVALDAQQREKRLSSWEDSIAYDEAASEGAWGMENKALLDGYTLMSLFFNEDWVFITTDLIASEFSSPYPRVMKRTVENGKQISKPAEGHPVQAILDDPAEYGDGPGFWYRAGVFYCLLGNSLLWYMRANKKFMLLPTHSTTLEFDQKGRPSQYLWIPDFVAAPGTQQSAIAFPAKDVLHIQRPNPGSPWWGLSPFIPGRRSVLFNRYSQEFLNSFFLKGATPQILVETEIAVNNKEAIATLAKSFELFNTGRGNARRPLVLPKGAKATPVNMTITDAKMVELVNQNRESILNLLRVPKHAVGLAETGSLGSEEHKVALQYMWSATIRPMLKRFAYALTKFMRPMLGDDHFIDFDTTDVEIFHDDSGKKALLAKDMLFTHTINEVRAELYEMDPIEGGDVVLELEKVKVSANPFGAPAPKPEELPPEQTSPEVAALPQEAGKQSDGSAPTPTRAKFAHVAKLSGGEGFKSHMKAVDEELERTQNDLEKWAQDELLKQLQVALKAIKGEVGGKAKADDTEVYRARIERALEALKGGFAESYTEKLASSVEAGYDAQLKLIFSPEARDAVQAVRERDAKGRREILQARGLRSFAFISKTTTDAVLSEVERGLEGNSTTAEIIRAIVDKFPAITFNRAKTIARTETLTAVSIGQGGALKNAAQVIPGLKKVWLTAKDDRVRDSHEALDGDMVDAKAAFESGAGNKLQFPRDPRAGAPEDVINCRCTVAMVAPEDMDQIDFSTSY